MFPISRRGKTHTQEKNKKTRKQEERNSNGHTGLLRAANEALSHAYFERFFNFKILGWMPTMKCVTACKLRLTKQVLKENIKQYVKQY